MLTGQTGGREIPGFENAMRYLQILIRIQFRVAFQIIRYYLPGGFSVALHYQNLDFTHSVYCERVDALNCEALSGTFNSTGPEEGLDNLCFYGTLDCVDHYRFHAVVYRFI